MAATGRALWSVAAVVLFAGVQAAIAAASFPDFMAYFNVAAGPRPERVLMPIDLDWGQDLKRLQSELRKRGVERVAVSLYSSADLPRHDLPGYTPLVPHTPQPGWIAVSLWKLNRDLDYNWLRAFEPVARVGSSINLYHITDEAAVAKLAPAIIELAPGVYMRDKKQLHGSNQAFVEFDSFVAVFDPSTIIQARQLLNDIRARTAKPIRFAIVSHFHPDHSAGAAVFAAAGAEIVASAAAKRDWEGWLRRDFANKTLSQPAEYRGVVYTLPKRWIEDKWVLDDGHQRLEILPVGHGHTSGDLIGWLPKYRILLAGDLATDGYLNLANASIGGWIAILDKLQALNPEKVVLGHGPLAGPQALTNSQRYLADLEQRVRGMVAKGLTYDDIAKWYSTSPVRAAPVDIELAYAEAGGMRTRAEPLLTRKRIAWGAVAAMTLVAIAAFVLWRRRRA
jgi:glyoxylase-like metal-dependent hydrolase (beta-lactamase superfamily II)